MTILQERRALRRSRDVRTEQVPQMSKAAQLINSFVDKVESEGTWPTRHTGRGDRVCAEWTLDKGIILRRNGDHRVPRDMTQRELYAVLNATMLERDSNNNWSVPDYLKN